MDQLWAWLAVVPWWGWLLIFLAIIAIKDIFFTPAHTIKHNFPIVGHLRYWLESVGPELRQYFVANNREELPFNRIERGWIYASAKKENNYEGFGTDRDVYAHHHIFIKNQMLAYKLNKEHPCQFTMQDIQMNVDDDFLHADLKSTYDYDKARVTFAGMQELYNCQYLGGKSQVTA